MFVIVEIDQGLVARDNIRVLGVYKDHATAERIRRDMHMDHVLAGTWRAPRTYVKKVEARP